MTPVKQTDSKHIVHGFLFMHGLNKEGLYCGTLYYIGSVENYHKRKYAFWTEIAEKYNYEVVLESTENSNVSVLFPLFLFLFLFIFFSLEYSNVSPWYTKTV